MKQEPTVLDYIKAKLSFRRGRKIEFSWEEPPLETAVEQPIESTVQTPVTEKPVILAGAAALFPWRIFLALLFSLIAQTQLEPPNRAVQFGLLAYGIAVGLLVWEFVWGKWDIAPLCDQNSQPMPLQIGWTRMLASMPLMLIAFFLFGAPLNPGYQFNRINILVWLLSLGLVLWSAWFPSSKVTLGDRLKNWLSILRRPIEIRITLWTVAAILAVGLVTFFRLYRLDQVPGEMFSDHAEKLLDVGDVLSGQTSIFFPRNTGREAFQMYLTAFVSIVFGTGLSFMSLKIGTALMGLVTLPFIYLLGKEIGNRWVGLLAFVLAGVAYWPNVISRIGLRFTLYPLFVAPLLYFLIRGLRNSNRNDLLLAGLALGMGLHGYSPMRILPIVILLLFGVYLLHPQSKGKRWQAIYALILLAYVAFVVFLPLFRYMLHDPEMFGYRAFSRVLETEHAYPAPVWQIFFSNLWKAMIMFFWDNGEIWVHSIPGRPALDVVSAVLLLLGVVTLVVRYIHKKDWVDIWLLLLIPLLMLPSILSLAFPNENPSLNRTGAAIVPVFVICALALEGILSAFIAGAGSRLGKILAVSFGLFLVVWCSFNNYDLVFRKFNEQFMAGAWNTSEIGRVIRGYVDSIGSPDTAYVVPYPYWVDTRLVGINAGFPTKDYALWPDAFETTLDDPRSKLFIVKSEDIDSVNKLRQLYPTGKLSLHPSPYLGKDFFIFFVPATSDSYP